MPEQHSTETANFSATFLDVDPKLLAQLSLVVNYLPNDYVEGFSLTARYYTALRGEEIPRLDLGGMRKYWEEALSHSSSPHVSYVLIGGFKNVTGEKDFFQPVVIKRASGIDNRLWAHRAIVAYEKLGLRRVRCSSAVVHET
jgi:hypothetical protein